MPRAPGFWREDGAAARLLAPLGAIYGAFAARRLRRPAPRAALPTIVVGGLTSGGDGKTPLVIALAEILTGMGERPALLTRGYGAQARMATPFVVAADNLERSGDEAPLLARHGLTILGADRVASAELARDLGATALILDDGFHSRHLAPDLALLAVDSDYGAGNGRCLPAGPLRAAIQAQKEAADALVIIGDGAAAASIPGPKLSFKAVIVAREKNLSGARVVAFAGIGRPEKFFRTLTTQGAQIVERRAFPDHHRFSASDIAELEALSRRYGATLVTTEKDALRLPPGALNVTTLPIRLVIPEKDALTSVLAAALRAARLSRAS